MDLGRDWLGVARIPAFPSHRALLADPAIRLKELDFEIENTDQVKDIKGIGKNTLARIKEVLENGYLKGIQKSDEIQDKMKTDFNPKTFLTNRIFKNWQLSNLDKINSALSNSKLSSDLWVFFIVLYL